MKLAQGEENSKAQEELKTQSKPENELNENLDDYDLGIIISLINSKSFKQHEKKQVDKVEEEIDKITKKIKNDIFYIYDEEEIAKQLRFLNSKININSRYDNNLAVSRDMLKKSILINERAFGQTINSLIDGKKSYKDKKYFFNELDTQIAKLKKIDLNLFRKTYQNVLDKQDYISTEYKTSYRKLQAQIKAQLLVYNYLKSNINKYRQSNFLIDELSLKYIINKIDTNEYTKNLSSLLDYYFGISIGKVIVLLVVLMSFMFINRVILPTVASFFTNRLTKKIPILEATLGDILPKSFKVNFSIIVYLFAIQISLYLIIEDLEFLSRLIPWFTTTYLALFSFMFYRILTNYINQSSDKIFSQYPNMRKEMVDFILRIFKVLILIFVLLFLLVQLGFDIKAIIASLGIGGIAVALAAKDTLSNFFGSLNIITDNSFSQGDWIKAGDIEGTVVDIRMRTTRIRTFANGMITVPNAQLANVSILNWSKRIIGRRIKMSVGITYSSKMQDIQNLVLDIRQMLETHPNIATSKLSIDKKPYLLKKEDIMGIKNTLLVYIDEYADSSINILIYCFSRSPVWEDWLETKQDIIIKISQLVEKNNCDFAFPTQTIYLEKEN